jgi:CxxC motif-containing protein (DUF1111 family)
MNRSGLRTGAMLLALSGAGMLVGHASEPDDSGKANKPGDALPGLTPDQRALFEIGEAEFEHEFTPSEGLGPVFIEQSCVTCHSLGGIGGGDSLENSNHLVRRFATFNPDGSYNNLAALGGDVLQTRSIAEFVAGCTVQGELVPPEATIHSMRNPLPMFGAGLVDAIPEASILARVGDQGDGVHGRANLDAGGHPGRFGWKAQGNALIGFNATAFNGTMAITTPQSPTENLPQGQVMPAGCTNADLGASTPNDVGGTRLLRISAWAALLAPVRPKQLDAEAQRGERTFDAIGCNKCHVSTMTTGVYQLAIPGGGTIPVDALSNQTVALYSDLLLHDMGAELDDQVTMRQAHGRDFRTAMLWGIRLRERFLHDGRASTVDEAILAHGGEAQIIRDRYTALLPDDRCALLHFLDRL